MCSLRPGGHGHCHECSYKRVKGRSHTVEKRKASHECTCFPPGGHGRPWDLWHWSVLLVVKVLNLLPLTGVKEASMDECTAWMLGSKDVDVGPKHIFGARLSHVRSLSQGCRSAAGIGKTARPVNILSHVSISWNLGTKGPRVLP